MIELPQGAVSVLKPKGTEETGADRPAAPFSLSSTPPAIAPLAKTVRLYGCPRTYAGIGASFH